jgi:hypothetical protein
MLDNLQFDETLQKPAFGVNVPPLSRKWCGQDSRHDNDPRCLCLARRLLADRVHARSSVAEIYRPWCVSYPAGTTKSCAFTPFEQFQGR